MRDDGAPDAPVAARDRIACLHLRAEAAGVRGALAQARAALAGLELTAECLADIELVLAEVLNNIVTHAYRGDPGPIVLDLGRDGRDLMCVVCDTGRAMPGCTAPRGAPAAVDVDVAALPEGGFGWFLIRTHARALRYARDGGINRLTLHLPLRHRAGTGGGGPSGPQP